MRGNSVIRPVLLRRSSNPRSISSSSLLNETPIPAPYGLSPLNSSITSKILSNHSSNAIVEFHFEGPLLQFQRTFCSSAGPSNIVLIKSEEQFDSALKNVQDKSLPAIFYFTAIWCGPCKFISPVISELSEKYPDVTTYKIDIDQEGLESTLNRLFISAVPTLHFFLNGKKIAEIVGADVARLRDTAEELYG